MSATQSSPYAGAMADVAAEQPGDDCYCPYFQHSIEVVGRRWSGSILRVIAERPRRFGEIRAEIPGLSDRLLTARLAELGDEGIVERLEGDGFVLYGLTAKGRDLGPVLDAVVTWARTHSAPEPAAAPGRIQSA